VEAVLIRCAGVGCDSVVEVTDDHEDLPNGWLRIHEVGDRDVACCSTVCVASWAAAGGWFHDPVVDVDDDGLPDMWLDDWGRTRWTSW
jgi:hypothetical protein